ncbi:glycosyltransferase family 39 protein [Rhodopseudomonas palustris]|uniref:ArnT family glycosyltransferase n=1 Tax=Rhodopseudomonas palustris TaxID=1076 RepID=UPI002ACDA161|nr:glycosyltransferase family 39 protein [Rhodopseudomonas palustris]WQH01166.1 glycosyltransferase family 39 protein [Rhodopseudomonas palustris]
MPVTTPAGAAPGLLLRACDVVLQILRGEPRRLLLWILGIYGGLWFVTAFSFPSLQAVSYEMALFGKELQAGTWKYPPLAPWLTEIASLLTGGWSGSQLLLSIGSALATLVLLWRLGAGIVGNTGATLAVALTILIGCFGPQVTGYDPAIASLPLTVAAVLLYRQAVLGQARSSWIGLGVVCALLGNANHAGFALILVLLGHLLLTREGRRQLGTLGPPIAAVVCFVVLLPHLIWLGQANASAPAAAGAAADLLPRIGAAFAFVFGQVGLHGGLILIAVLAMLPRLPLQGAPATIELDTPSRFDRSLILAAAFVPSLLVAVGSVPDWFTIGAYTGSALVPLSGLALLLLLPRRLVLRAPRLAVVAWLLVLVGVPFATTASIYAKAYGDGPPPTELYPARALSHAMQAVWKSRTTRPLDIVTGSARQAGFVAFDASPRPSVFIDADFGKSPWITPQRLKQSGTLVVWSTDEFARTDEIPAPYRGALGSGTPVFGTMVLPLGRGKLKAYGWAMIAPDGETLQAPAPPAAK